MKKINNKIYLVCILLVVNIFFLRHNGNAQSYHATPHMYNAHSLMHNSSYAKDRANRITVYLPDLFLSVSNTGPKFSQLFVEGDNGTYILDDVSAVANTNTTNAVQSAFDLHLIGLAYAFDRFTLSAGYGIRNIGYVSYPKELLQLYANGNAHFIGQQVSVGPSLLAQSFYQYSIGLDYYYDKLSIGIQGKYLSGIYDISTSSNDIRLATGSDYSELYFDNQFQLNTTTQLAYEDLSNISIEIDGNKFKKPINTNRGFAFDVAMSYQVNEKFILRASIQDLGKINWKDEAKNFISDSTFTYSGVDILDVLREGEDYNLQDSLSNFLEIEETNQAYSTSLPRRLSLGGTYMWNDKLTLNGSVHWLGIQDESYLSAFAGLQYRLHSNIHLSTSLGLINQNSFALGFGASLHFGPYDMFLYTNNILGLIDILEASIANVHVGSSLSF